MKHKITLSLFAIVAMCFSAGAQHIVTVVDNATVPASLSNVLNTTISAVASKDVAVGVNFKLMGAGTSPILFNFDSSGDGVNWVSNSHGFVLTAAGTAQINYLTNWTLNGIPYMRIGRVFNTNASIATNIVITANTKIGM